MWLKYKKHPSKYELKYITWNGIDFDKDKLIKFVKRIKWLKFLSIFVPSKKEELKILKEIYNSNDEELLIGLLDNDESISRKRLIEKWARIGAIDILLNNVFHRSTYTVLINLPIKDYQLVMKRIEELVSISRNTTYQSEVISNDIPGL